MLASLRGYSINLLPNGKSNLRPCWHRMWKKSKILQRIFNIHFISDERQATISTPILKGKLDFNFKAFFSYKYIDLIPICRIQKLFEKVNNYLFSVCIYLDSISVLHLYLSPH